MKTDLLWWQKAWVSALTEGVCCSWRHSLKSNASENRRTLFSISAKRCNFSFNKNHEDPETGIRLPHSLAVGCWASIAIAMKKLRICEWAACASWQWVPCAQPSGILRMLLMKSAWAWLAGMGKSCCWSLHNTQQRDRRKGVSLPLSLSICMYIWAPKWGKLLTPTSIFPFFTSSQTFARTFILLGQNEHCYSEIKSRWRNMGIWNYHRGSLASLRSWGFKQASATATLFPLTHFIVCTHH